MKPNAQGLKKKLGPLPMWAWILVAGGTIGLLWFMSSKGKSQQAATPPVTPSADPFGYPLGGPPASSTDPPGTQRYNYSRPTNHHHRKHNPPPHHRPHHHHNRHKHPGHDPHRFPGDFQPAPQHHWMSGTTPGPPAHYEPLPDVHRQ